MNEPTKKDWIQLANSAVSCINDAVVEVGVDISHIKYECEKLKGSIDWSWEVFTDADGQPKAVYWDDATEEEREMLDYFAKFEYAKQDVMKKLKQALDITVECEEIMKTITNLEKSK